MREPVVALTTLPADFDAVPLAQALVAAGLAACVNIVPAVTSVYTWKGEPQIDREQQLIIKTTADMTGPLWDAIKTGHPYEVPEFLILSVTDGSEDYLTWIIDSVAPQRES